MLECRGTVRGATGGRLHRWFSFDETNQIGHAKCYRPLSTYSGPSHLRFKEDSLGRWAVEISIIALLALYTILAGGYLYAFQLWIYLPLYLLLPVSALRTRSNQSKGVAFFGFLIGCNVFMLPTHIAWFLDIDGTQTGGSTSALIFAVMPVWSFLFGVVGAAAFVLGYRILARRDQRL